MFPFTLISHAAWIFFCFGRRFECKKVYSFRSIRSLFPFFSSIRGVIVLVFVFFSRALWGLLTTCLLSFSNLISGNVLDFVPFFLLCECMLLFLFSSLVADFVFFVFPDHFGRFGSVKIFTPRPSGRTLFLVTRSACARRTAIAISRISVQFSPGNNNGICLQFFSRYLNCQKPNKILM